MKHLFSLTAIICGSIFITGCGDEKSADSAGENTVTIETKDVKGTIEVNDLKKQIKGNLHTNDGESEQAILKFNSGNEMSIAVSSQSFEDYMQQLSTDLDGTFNKKEILATGDNYVFYKVTTKPFNENEDPVEGYSFCVVVENPSGAYYHLTAEGKEAFTPVADKKEAEKLLTMARTFKGE